MTTSTDLEKNENVREQRRNTEGYRGPGLAYHISQSIFGLTALAALIMVGKLSGADPVPWNVPRVSTTDVAPVVTEMRPRFWAESDSGVWSASVFGTKGENNCVFVTNQQVTAVVSTQSPSKEISVTFVDDDTPGSTRPSGEQFFGVWRFDADNLHERDQVTVVLKHYCAGVGVVATTIGPWRIAVDGG